MTVSNDGDGTEPMDVEQECEGHDYVIHWLDGSTTCYDGDLDNSGLNSWTVEPDGRTVRERTFP